MASVEIIKIFKSVEKLYTTAMIITRDLVITMKDHVIIISE